jgi:hypothetical protein
MKRVAFSSALMAIAVCANLTGQTTPATGKHIDPRVGIDRLKTSLKDATGSCIVSFKTDTVAGQRLDDAAKKVMIPLTGYSSIDQKIAIKGELLLVNEIFGKGDCPSPGRITLEIPEITSAARPNPHMQQFMPLFEDVLEGEAKQRLFILVSSDKTPKSIEKCEFIGPLDRGDVESVVECVKFMRQHPTIDETTRQTMLSSKNPWIKELAASIETSTSKTSK